MGVGQQAVAVKTLDVIALVGAAVAPDMDIVFLHRRHQHGAGHGAAQRRGVEVGSASGRDMEGAGLQRGQAFGGELAAAVDQARQFGAVLHRLARNLFVVGLVGLAEVGGVGVGQGALLLHPVQCGAGIEPAGESDADFLAGGNVLKNGRHGASASAEMADVVIRPVGRCHANLEARVAWNAELFSTGGAQPFGAAGQFVVASTADTFHGFGRTGIEGQGGGQHHTDALFAAVGQAEVVAHAAAVEVDVGLGRESDVEKGIGGHGLPGNEAADFRAGLSCRAGGRSGWSIS